MAIWVGERVGGLLLGLVVNELRSRQFHSNGRHLNLLDGEVFSTFAALVCPKTRDCNLGSIVARLYIVGILNIVIRAFLEHMTEVCNFLNSVDFLAGVCVFLVFVGKYHLNIIHVAMNDFVCQFGGHTAVIATKIQYHSVWTTDFLVGRIVGRVVHSFGEGVAVLVGDDVCGHLRLACPLDFGHFGRFGLFYLYCNVIGGVRHRHNVEGYILRATTQIVARAVHKNTRLAYVLIGIV